LQGHAIRAVIEAVQVEDVKNEDGLEKKLVAHFVGKEKTLILNRTNCETLEQIIGVDDYGAWAGHTIVLFPTTTKFGTKTVPCLRIRAVQAAAAPPPPPPPSPQTVDSDDEIPF